MKGTTNRDDAAHVTPSNFVSSMADRRYHGSPSMGTTTQIISGKKLALGSFWNLTGFVFPGAAALFALPRIIDVYGVDRFGVLAIFWLAVGYFGLFDFGLGRALTRMVAFHDGNGEHDQIPALVWTGLWMMFGLGMVSAAVVFWGAPWASAHLLRIPVALRAEAVSSSRVIAICLPALTLAAGLRGVLEAKQRFAAISVVRIGLGVLIYVGPLLVLPWSRTLMGAVVVLVVARYATMFAQLGLCLHWLPELRTSVRPRREAVGPLVRFGGWMTVSNLVSPIMANLDRLLIGVILSTAAVTYYAAPQEVVTKLNVIPGALVIVLFPVFSHSFSKRAEEVTRLYNRAMQASIVALAPIVLFLAAFAEPILQFWLKHSYNPASAAVLRWLAIGVLMNGVAQVPFALVQGAGRPDLTAKIHLIELPIFCVLFFILTRANGVAGAAEAWTVRVLLDLVALVLAATICDRRFRFERSGVLQLVFVCAAAIVDALLHSMQIKVPLFVLELVPVAMIALKTARSVTMRAAPAAE